MIPTVAPTVLPLPTLLGVLFIGLKLTGHIAWSWLWVLSPFWLPFALLAVLCAGALLFGVLAGFFK